MNKISSTPPSPSPAISSPPGIGPVIGDESPSQLFRSMLSGNLARMTLPYSGTAPLPGPRPVPTAPEQAKPNASSDDGISDTQREEARLSARNGSKAPAAPAPVNRKADAQPDGTAVEEPMPAAPQAESQQSGAEGKAASAVAPADGTAKSVNEPDKAPQAARSEVHTDARSETAATDKTNDTDAPPTDDAAATPPLLDPAALQAAAQLKDKSAGTEAEADNGAAGAGKRPAAVAGNAARDASRDAQAATDAAGSSTAAQGDAASTTAATATSTFAGLLGAARSGPAAAVTPDAAAAAHTDAGALAALQGAGNASSGSAVANNGTASAAAPSHLVLAQPLQDPSFASEMAAKLSVLASKGVQEAHLHLNPAEMGPVAVQIVVDGQQARISFHAEQAETRAVLEHSLPDLAAALRDTGLTLSGGGVFQQASGSGQGGGAFQQARDGNAAAASANARTQRMADESLPALGRSAAARTTRGVLDLYA